MPSEIQVTNIEAEDGTSALTISDSTGNVSINNDLDVGTQIKSNGTLCFSKDNNNNINIGSDVASLYAHGIFHKVDPTVVLFNKTGTGTAETQTVVYVEVNGKILEIASGTSVDMPSLTTGTDYAIWAETDGSLQASINHTSPPSTNARKIGGFHYAPGSNASGTSGGNTTSQINEYSFWDLKFRPDCPDPRGMTLVADSFWADIYLLGGDHHLNGTSKYNVSIADDSNFPKKPLNYGGTGSNYEEPDWWGMAEVMQSHGKRLPTYDEYSALAYGTTEQSAAGGNDVPSTGVGSNWNNFTSKWGVIQSTGCLYIWGDHFGGGADSAVWNAATNGRGSIYQQENAVRMGGAWYRSSESGSRGSSWINHPMSRNVDVTARGVCEHYTID